MAAASKIIEIIVCTLKKVSVFVLRAAAALEGRVSKVLPLFG